MATKLYLPKNNIVDTSTEEITLSYFKDIAVEGPARLHSSILTLWMMRRSS